MNALPEVIQRQKALDALRTEFRVLKYNQKLKVNQILAVSGITPNKTQNTVDIFYFNNFTGEEIKVDRLGVNRDLQTIIESNQRALSYLRQKLNLEHAGLSFFMPSRAYKQVDDIIYQVTLSSTERAKEAQKDPYLYVHKI